MQKFKNNVQKEHKLKTTNYIIIPRSLRDAVRSLNLTTTYTNHSFKFIGIILRESYRQFDDIFQLVDIPQKYLTKTFDDKYLKWLMPLVNTGIIIRDNFYCEITHQSKKYRINPEYYSIDDMDLVLFTDTVKVNSDNILFANHFKDCIDTLTIDFDVLKNITSARVNNLTINDFATNESIPETRKIKLINSIGKPYFIDRDSAIKKAIIQKKILIQDKKQYMIENSNDFINRKKLSILTNYGTAIENLKNGNIRATRNETNNRLDTNITNLCSELTDEICNQNNLVQIDLKNSQFTILSWVLSDKLNTDDYKLFKTLSSSGQLYEFIQEKLGLNTRKEAKLAMFEILFSSRKNNTQNKTRIKELFTSVIAWVDNYKEEYGDSEFAIMLQKEESKIFIDGILKSLIKRKMFCLTKHDSLIVRAEDKDTVLDLVVNWFNKIGLDHTLDIKMPMTKKTETKNEMIKLSNKIVFTLSDDLVEMWNKVKSKSKLYQECLNSRNEISFRFTVIDLYEKIKVIESIYEQNNIKYE